MKSLTLKFFSLILLGFTLSHSQSVDSTKVREHYENGDFEKALYILQDFKAQNDGSEWNRSDSIFVFKHLGAIYASRPGENEISKYYFKVLAQLCPSLDSLGNEMYPSEKVASLYKEAHAEYLTEKNENDVQVSPDSLETDALATTQKDSMTVAENLASQTENTDVNKLQEIQKPAKNKGAFWTKKKYYWIAGFAAISGGLTLYLLQDNPDNTKINRISVPEK